MMKKKYNYKIKILSFETIFNFNNEKEKYIHKTKTVNKNLIKRNIINSF